MAVPAPLTIRISCSPPIDRVCVRVRTQCRGTGFFVEAGLARPAMFKAPDWPRAQVGLSRERGFGGASPAATGADASVDSDAADLGQ